MVGLLVFVRLSSDLGFGNLRRVTRITKKPYYSQARSLSKEVSLIRRGAFKTAVVLALIACSASEAAAPGNAFGNGSHDAFVSRLNANGVPYYSTFLGGNGDDDGQAIAVDSAGSGGGTSVESAEL